MLRFLQLLTMVFILCTAAVGGAFVDWRLTPAIDIGQTPKDAVVSISGKWIYVLTKTGDILIYSRDGQLEDTIHVGKEISFITPGPTDNQLLVISGSGKTVSMLSMEFVREIDIAGAPALGLFDAPVTIVVFMDYQCPYCVRLMPVLKQVLEKYPQQVKIAYKQYPLKMHQAALSASAASLSAAQENRFQEFHDVLLEDHENLTDENILDKATKLGFDREAFRKKMGSPSIMLQIQKDMEDGKKADVSGIPSVFINGKRLKNRSLEGFQKMIDQEIIDLDGRPAAIGF